MTRARMGTWLGGINIAFSLLCFFITPVFTPAFILAVLFGALSGAIALALQARRTAFVALAFALVPPIEFLLIQKVVERAGTGAVVYIPLVAALAFAVWALIDYSRARRAPA
jgi:hypothetical protein